PLRRVLGRVLKHHPYGALTHLRRKLTGRLVILHGSNLSRSGASDKPGAVHILMYPGLVRSNSDSAGDQNRAYKNAARSLSSDRDSPTLPRQAPAGVVEHRRRRTSFLERIIANQVHLRCPDLVAD